MEEIVVRAKPAKLLTEVARRDIRAVTDPAPQGDVFERLLKKETSEFQKLLRQDVTPRDEVMEEVVTKAKRIPKPTYLTRLLGPLSAATSVAELGAMISDQISQTRLDEAGREATATDFPGPDTAVRTIQPERIPEIVVKAKRVSQRAARPKFNFPTARVLSGVGTFAELMAIPSKIGEPRPLDLSEIQATAPDLSKIRVESSALPDALQATLPETSPTRKTKTQAQKAPPTVTLPTLFSWPVTAIRNKLKTKTQMQKSPPNNVLPVVFRDPIVKTAPMPIPNPLLDNAPPDKFRPTRLTRSQPRVVPFRVPRTQTARAGFCPPCPKKTKTVKKRRECWKKLVREFADPRRDKVYKWERIDCKTGRPIKKRNR